MRSKKILSLFLILSVGAFLFYWFQLRPIETRKQCLKEVQAKFGKSPNTAISSAVIKINKDFRTCLANHGLKPESLYEEPKPIPESVDKPEPEISEPDTNDVENSINDLKDTIEQQNEDMKYEQKRRGWCEGGGGVYYGNGTCITDN